MANPNVEPLAYTVSEACQASRLSPAHLYRLMAQGKLEKRKVGTRTLIPAASLRRLVCGDPS